MRKRKNFARAVFFSFLLFPLFSDLLGALPELVRLLLDKVLDLLGADLEADHLGERLLDELVALVAVVVVVGGGKGALLVFLSRLSRSRLSRSMGVVVATIATVPAASVVARWHGGAVDAVDADAAASWPQRTSDSCCCPRKSEQREDGFLWGFCSRLLALSLKRCRTDFK